MSTPADLRNPDDPLASAWMSKVDRAERYYTDWSEKFKCNTLEEYYYGFQWRDQPISRYDRYVINFIFSTLEIKKPSLLFQDIAFRVKPKPKSVDFDYESAVRRCQLREDTVNTVISDEENRFDEEFEMFITDAFFRFGIMEVGYSANWIDNPKAGQPILRSDNDPFVDPENERNVIRQPEELPENEQVYMKRIPAWRFRVGGIDGFNFQKCSWVGYYDFVRIEDLKANRSLKNLDKIEFAGGRSDDFNPTAEVGGYADEDSLMKSGDYAKIWKIWDLRAKKVRIFLSSQCITLQEQKFKHLPLVALKFINKLRGWYPLPLVFNWKSPQDEINEAREQQKTHRRRANRKYLYRDNAFADDGEISKLEDGPDMTFAKVQADPSTSVVPLQNATLDNVTTESMVVGRDDLNIITGTSSEQRGQSDRTTATQANLIDMRSQLRETYARNKVANVLKEIGRLVILTVQEKFTVPTWIKMNTIRSDENFLEQEGEVQTEWQQITGGELGEDLDFEVNLSVDSISPIENAQSKQAYVDFLSLCTNFPQTAFSATLVRENAYRSGYRNEKVIREMMKMAQIAALGQEMQANQSLAQMGGGEPIADTRVKQMQTPTQAQTQTQLQGQLPVQ